MPTLSLQSLHHAYGSEPVLDAVEWQLNTNERLCLVGRNGEGKSTLLRLLAGVETPDQGTIGWSEDAQIGYVPQSLPPNESGTIRSFVLAGGGQAGTKLLAYEDELLRDPQSAAVGRLQQWLDDNMAWGLAQRVDTVLNQFDLQPGTPLNNLSGGWRRKALVARALIAQPNVLLLDEPTNHLDIDSIEWLEQFLRGFRGLVIFVSHDRQFIDAVAETIVELDRSNLYRYPAPYESFLMAREERLRIEAEQQARFDRRLAQEETWIRQGIKARRTRNEGRVRRLEALRAQRAERRELGGSARMELQAAERSGKLVFELQNLTFHYGEHCIVRDFSTEVLRGDTIALLGPNGVGKTTLVRLLLGELEPDGGEVRVGTRLQSAYFDQGRHQLDPDRSVMDTLSEGREFIEINGQRIHVVSWLERFLFTSQQARSPVRTLSGGEANRLLLAKLFSQPANLLIMDEPTNDLDLDTLELLEELIVDFPGTVIVISHDRYFIDHVATRVWGMSGGGKLVNLVGG
ncbi:MAG: ATP-binding cassette domain-containing protein, partial [Natronospirillum sp.]|uniref:ATP-binding cassette domain-containing protein n=1 Tax=Natronospirillum sp. TaxID=2812955 RepID=UPI0025DE8C6F